MSRSKSKKSNTENKKNNIENKNGSRILIIILVVALLLLVIYKLRNSEEDYIDVKFADNNVLIYNGIAYKYKFIKNNEYIEFCQIDYCSSCKMSVNIKYLLEASDDEEIENKCYDETFEASIKTNKKFIEKILEYEKEKNK